MLMLMDMSKIPEFELFQYLKAHSLLISKAGFLRGDVTYKIRYNSGHFHLFHDYVELKSDLITIPKHRWARRLIQNTFCVWILATNITLHESFLNVYKAVSSDQVI